MDLATSTVASPPESLIKFCILWTVLQRSQPPKVCDSVLKMEEYRHDQEAIDKVFLSNRGLLKRLKMYNNYEDEDNQDILQPSRDTNNAFQFHFKHSSRSLSVIG